MVYMIQRDGLKFVSEVEDDLLSELHPQPMRRGLECALIWRVLPFLCRLSERSA